MVVKVAKDFTFGIIKYYSTPFHDNLCHIHRLFQVKELVTLRTSPGERRDKVAVKTTAIKIGTHTHHGSGVEHRIYATFAVVAHDQARKLKAAVDKPPRRVMPHFYRGIGIF